MMYDVIEAVPWRRTTCGRACGAARSVPPWVPAPRALTTCARRWTFTEAGRRIGTAPEAVGGRRDPAGRLAHARRDPSRLLRRPARREMEVEPVRSPGCDPAGSEAPARPNGRRRSWMTRVADPVSYLGAGLRYGSPAGQERNAPDRAPARPCRSTVPAARTVGRPPPPTTWPSPVPAADRRWPATRYASAAGAISRTGAPRYPPRRGSTARCPPGRAVRGRQLARRGPRACRHHECAIDRANGPGGGSRRATPATAASSIPRPARRCRSVPRGRRSPGPCATPATGPCPDGERGRRGRLHGRPRGAAALVSSDDDHVLDRVGKRSSSWPKCHAGTARTTGAGGGAAPDRGGDHRRAGEEDQAARREVAGGTDDRAGTARPHNSALVFHSASVSPLTASA
ncbi:hypothetical protein HBB16_00170 [Pseudonocardia sp. MCCB 268]|nr:hypothetical protein [Pseudonocardia cytotoxica]